MNKLKLLQEKIKAKRKLLIAFSGGVDSGLVAKVANDMLGESACAVTANFPMIPKKELEEAKKLAKKLKLRHRIINLPILRNEKVVENSPERCYHCRKELALELKKIAQTKKIKTIADGVTLSDFSEHRPGIRAANELNIWHPLVEAGMNKSDVRALAKKIKLSVHQKPSLACLASRIPYGERITKEKLKRIEQAEDYLSKLGFRQVRVRAHKNIARIEVDIADVPKIAKQAIRKKIINKLKQIGFVYVTLDLEGYRAGSLDEVL